MAFFRTPLKINDKGIFRMPKLRSEAFCKMPLKLLRVFFRTLSNADGGISINALKNTKLKMTQIKQLYLKVNQLDQELSVIFNHLTFHMFLVLYPYL